MRTGGSTNNQVGSVQDDATRLPRRQKFYTGDPDPAEHHHNTPTWRNPQGKWEVPSQAGDYDYLEQSAPTEPAGRHVHTIAGCGDPETRPKNAYVHWIIKYRRISL